MTINRQQAIDYISQYQSLGLDLNVNVQGTDYTCANKDIQSIIDVINFGAYDTYELGLTSLLLRTSVSLSNDTIISISNAA